MKRIATLFIAAAMAVFLYACGTSPDVIKHQATAKSTAAKWQAKADIAKWEAAKALANSGSDVGRSSAGFALQADALASGGSKGAASTGSSDYTQDPSALDYLFMFSRELRGWAAPVLQYRMSKDSNAAQRAMAADQQSTYRFMGQQLGDTARAGMGASSGLAADALSKIPPGTPAE